MGQWSRKFSRRTSVTLVQYSDHYLGMPCRAVAVVDYHGTLLLSYGVEFPADVKAVYGWGISEMDPKAESKHRIPIYPDHTFSIIALTHQFLDFP